MNVSFDLSALRKTKWYEYALRFVFGGAITVAAGVLAQNYGPAIGGLFLAFPAIFPASATLVEKHQRQKKQAAGIVKTERGIQAAALDAYGASLGSLGLLCFAIVVWRFVRAYNPIVILFTAAATWALVSVLVWRWRKSSWWP